MHLPDLNDDVLLQICDFLTSKHALSLSLTSRRLHDLAIRRATATVYATSLMGLQAFHRYVLHGSRLRTRYLKSLSIDYEVFSCYSPGYDPEALAIPLLIDLFLNAHNLSSLSLDSVHSLFQEYPGSDKLLLALSSLRNIKRVKLSMLTDTDLASVAGMGWDLRALHLELGCRAFEWHSSRTKPKEDAEVTYPVLLDALTHFPSLDTLRITDFELVEWEQFGEALHNTTPVFPSIRRVFISYGHALPALALVGRCPNIELVELVDISWEDGPNPEEVASRPCSSWPALRSLRCNTFAIYPVCCTPRVLKLGTADHLQLQNELSVVDVENYSEDQSALLCILQCASPLWLQLRVEVGAQPMRFWADVVPLAPRLRYLELSVTIRSLKEEYVDWLENVSGMLSSLSLLYLRLHIPTLPARRRVGCDTDGRALYNVTEEAANAFYAAREVTLRTLPERCAHAIPTLMFFVRVHGRFRLDAGRAAGNWQEETGEEEFDEDEVREALEPDDYDPTNMWASILDCERPWIRTWRVEREGGGYQLQQLTVERGARLRKCLEGIWYGRDPLDDVLALHRACDPSAQTQP
ncbi:hypothetical protein C8Q80DRAFT_1160695 [Daedaleopsis nitida]|nr:hypothetical protein C8Q80DRAFT_1160695 [Daedaleopsis nitida]